MYHHLRKSIPTSIPIHVYGFDLDSELIDRAKAKVSGASVLVGGDDRITFQTLDLTSPEANTTFGEITKSYDGIDLISCYSTTMWIHIHGKFERLMSSNYNDQLNGRL